MSLTTLVLLPFIGSLLAAVLPTNARNTESTLAGLVAVFCAIQAALYFPDIANGGVLIQHIEWIPQLGLNLTLRLDGFAWMFCLLVLGVGSLVVLYARYYMSAADPVPRFFSFFLAFMGAMVGVVLSGNLIQIALFWELTSLFSFLLIGYWHHRKDARRGARMALTVTGTGGLCMLAGMLVLGHIVGSYDLDTVLASAAKIQAHPPVPHGAGVDPDGRTHQERAVPLSLLAAACDGCAHPRVGVPALGHHGQGGCFSAGTAVARAQRHRALVLAGGRCGLVHAC